MIVISVLFSLFVCITLLKKWPLQVNSENVERESTFVNKEKIRRFWEIYRQAGEDRIAGRLRKAAHGYRNALKLNEQHEDALYYLGNVSLELGEFKDAEKAWKDLVEINPNSTRAHFQLGDLYLAFRQNELFAIRSAESEYRLALEINKEETGPLLRLGQVALIKGNLSAANKFFYTVIGSNYKSVEAHFLKGYIAWKTGNLQDALTLLTKAARYSRPLEPIEGVLGESDTKSGQSFLQRRASFLAHVADLSNVDESNVSKQIELRYQELDAFLEDIRRVWIWSNGQ